MAVSDRGSPSILLGFVTWFYLTERPSEAKSLETDERRWLSDRIDTEHSIKKQQLQLSVVKHSSILALLRWGWSALLWPRCCSALVSFYQPL